MLDVQDTEQGRLTCQILPFIAGYSRLEGTVIGSCCRRAVDGYQCRGECSAVSVKEGSDLHITKFIMALGTDRRSQALNMAGFQDCFVK